MKEGDPGYISKIGEFQRVQDVWQHQINPTDELTPSSRFDRMAEEVYEARHEADTFNGSKGSTERLAGEVTDVIFIALGVLSILGVDAEVELNKVMERVQTKYNPFVNRQLREQGMTPHDAQAHQKATYKPKV